MIMEAEDKAGVGIAYNACWIEKSQEGTIGEGKMIIRR